MLLFFKIILALFFIEQHEPLPLACCSTKQEREFTDLDDAKHKQNQCQMNNGVFETLDTLYNENPKQITTVVGIKRNGNDYGDFGHAAVFFRIDSLNGTVENYYCKTELMNKETARAIEGRTKISDLQTKKINTAAFLPDKDEITELDEKISNLQKEYKSEFAKGIKLRVRSIAFSTKNADKKTLNLIQSTSEYQTLYSSSFDKKYYTGVNALIMCISHKKDDLDKHPKYVLLTKQLQDQVDSFNGNCLEFAELILSPIPNPFKIQSCSKIPYYEEKLRSGAGLCTKLCDVCMAPIAKCCRSNGSGSCGGGMSGSSGSGSCGGGISGSCC